MATPNKPVAPSVSPKPDVIRRQAPAPSVSRTRPVSAPEGFKQHGPAPVRNKRTSSMPDRDLPPIPPKKPTVHRKPSQIETIEEEEQPRKHGTPPKTLPKRKGLKAPPVDMNGNHSSNQIERGSSETDQNNESNGKRKKKTPPPPPKRNLVTKLSADKSKDDTDSSKTEVPNAQRAAAPFTPPRPPPKPNSRTPSVDTNSIGRNNSTQIEQGSPGTRRESFPKPTPPERSSSMKGKSQEEKNDQDSPASRKDLDPDVNVPDPLFLGYQHEIEALRRTSFQDNDQIDVKSPSLNIGGIPRRKPVSERILGRQTTLYRRKDTRPKTTIGVQQQFLCSRCLTRLANDEIDVHFVTVVSPDFGFDENTDAMFVRIAGAEFGNMKEDCLQMRLTRTLKDKFLLFEGSRVFKLSQVIDKVLGYIYLVVKGDVEHWESISKNGKEGEWYRCLQVHSTKYHGNGVWIQYDWPVHMEAKERRRISRIGSSRNSTLIHKNTQDRELAVHVYLPEWEGFRQTMNVETMEASKAIGQVEQVWNCLTDSSLRNIGTGDIEVWELTAFDMQKTVLDFLCDKISSYKSKATIDINHDQLHSALAICYLVDQHLLPISDSQLNRLWDGLMLSSCSEDMCVTVLQSIRRSFGVQLQNVLRSLESQCQGAIQKAWKTGDHRWLASLPLLHFLRGDSQPFSSVDIHPETDFSDPNCWGLRGLNANKGWVLRADSGALTQITRKLESLSPLVEQDRLLSYTFLWLLLTAKEQRGILVDFKERLPKKHKVHPYPVLYAMDSVLLKLTSNQHEPRSPGGKQIAWDIKHLVKDIAYLCDVMVAFLNSNRIIFTNIGEKFINLSVSIAQSTILLGTMKQHELVIRSYTLLALCIASLEQGEEADQIYAKIRLPVVELVEWLRQNLPAKFLDYNTRDSKPNFPVEWVIWKDLFKLTFPNVFADKWKQSLLKLFQDRLSNTISDAARVKIGNFTTGIPDLDHVIHYAAVDAMEKMLQNQTKRGSRRTVIKSKEYEQVGDLMSELLKTSLPKGSEQPNEEEQWIMLQKLLEWEPIVTLIKMSAGDEKVVFDSEASSGIAAVINLIRDMCTKLLDGTIQLRQLHAIVGNEGRLQRYIDIYKCSAVNKTYTVTTDDEKTKSVTVSASEMETLLKMRQKELQSIEEKQPWTKNFVEMCRSLAPGIQVDTAQLVNKAVFDVKISPKTLMQHCTTITYRRKSIVSSGDVNKYQPVVKIVVPAPVMQVLQPLYDCKNIESRVFSAICRHQAELVSLKIEQSRICSTVYAAREIWRPVLDKWLSIKEGLSDGSISCEDIQSYFGEFADSETALREELCKFSEKDEGLPRWLGDRVKQLKQLFQVQSSLELARILIDVIDVLGLTETRIADIGSLEDLATSGSQSLNAISSANKISKVAKELSSVNSAEADCIKQVIESQEVVKWIRNNVQDVQDFFDFIDAIQNTELETDAQFDAMSAFSRAVDGYAPLIFDLTDSATLDDVIEACQRVWSNLRNDKNMATVLRDSQKYLDMLQQFREDRGYTQSTAIQEVETINARGVYTIGKQPSNEEDIYYCKPTQELFQLMVGKDPNNSEGRSRAYDVEELQELERSITLMSSNVTAKPEKQVQLLYFTDVLTLVQQAGSTYEILCSAGCNFFREWGAKLNCFHYHSKPSIIAHFGTGKAISGSREITKELVALRIFMESCTGEWFMYLSRMRSKLYYLNFFTNAQLTQIRQALALHESTGDLLPQIYALLGKLKTNCSNEHVEVAISRCKLSDERRDIAMTLNQALIDQARNQSSIQETFQHLWQTYLQNISHGDLGKSISLEQVGKFLAQLAKLDEPIRRRPFMLKEGQPNLIQCENDDLLVSILSLYDNDSNDDSLPSADEVLLCDADTSEEQVDLLFRRSFGDPNGRVFCLASPENLQSQVSSAVLRRFNFLTRDRSPSKYRLVVVHTNKKAALVSPLVEAFGQYKTTLPSKQGLRPKVKKYLERMLMREKGTLTSQCPVQVLSSTQPGTGKSLEVHNRASKLHAILRDKGDKDIKLKDICVSVPIQGDAVDVDAVISTIWNHMTICSYNTSPHIIHFDLSPSVRNGLDSFLFQLLVTGSITDPRGTTWRRRPDDQYILEVTDLPINPKGSITKNRRFFNLLPCITLYTPKEVYWQLHANQQQQRGKDTYPETLESAMRLTLESPEIKYAFQHLRRLDKNLDLEEYNSESDQAPCRVLDILETLLKYCGSEDPCWRSLQYFASFLALQLKKCQSSGLLEVRNLRKVGFKKFAVKFLARMAKEFVTPSLKFTEGTHPPDGNAATGQSSMYHLQRAWNTSSHSYMFFNKEGEGSITFYGCTFDPEGSLIDSVSKKVLEEKMISSDLMHGLKWNGTNFSGDDDANLKELCMVLGVRYTQNPDTTYKLTPDNVKRILAIDMRLRCGIPVVIMGDRGCGKTRLIRYMCQLKAMDPTAKNLIHVKVHSGTSANDIMMSLTRAEYVERLNRESHNVDTILYFDEANTTEAIDLIKEIMCDGRAKGHPINLGNGSLKIIASCNPYRKHSEALVHRLKSAGLGFNKLVHQRRKFQGAIPFGEMVYNVRPLPPSMLDFVWDYGQLGVKAEREYILQMVIETVECGRLQVNNPQEAAIIAYILHSSHTFLSKKQQDECGLVSLKDVERCLAVLVWFLEKMPVLDEAMQRLISSREKSTSTDQSLSSITRASVLALGVCYYARLDESRSLYLEDIAVYFKGPFSLPGGAQRMEQEISNCQSAFMNELKLPSNIACNAALKENVFMMVVCIELGIPLFLIGKPGTSKSLAKTVVADAMEGPASGSALFKTLRRVQFTTYQCNPNTNKKDINSTFEEASLVRDAHRKEPFVSAVCLDEIGLAEGSTDTPLKILQPYLEYYPEEEEEEIFPPRASSQNISFIGMSNWAVDAANMNTGIVLILQDPDHKSLVETAKGLCSSDEIYMMLGEGRSLIPALATAFLTIYEQQQHDYFGYPDFYNLIKIMVGFCKKYNRGPTWSEVEHSIRRNFDQCGSDKQWSVFRGEMEKYGVVLWNESTSDDPYCTDVGLIRSNIEMNPNLHGETRHMLVETENYAAFSILLDHLLKDKSAIPFFGSNFRLDQTYSQMCRSLNRIKRCMENGRIVILANHSKLFECLHDVLNLHHVSFAGQNYVELALGTNRVKSRIHKDFRLIVVENRDIVNTCFSSPLLGRFEKHYLAATTMLTHEQKFIADRVKAWLARFADSIRHAERSASDIQDTIIGYHKDVIPSLVYRECRRSAIEGDEYTSEVIFQNVQNALMECASTAAKTNVSSRQEAMQGYSSLGNFLWKRLHYLKEVHGQGDLAQITTNSDTLTDSELTQIEEDLRLDKGCIQMKNLLQYDTEQQFRRDIRRFYSQSRPAQDIYMILQCRDGHQKSNLIACVTHYVQDERSISRHKDTRAHVILLINFPKGSRGFRGFPGGEWISAHIPSLVVTSTLMAASPSVPSAPVKLPKPPPPAVGPKPHKESPYATFVPQLKP